MITESQEGWRAQRAMLENRGTEGARGSSFLGYCKRIRGLRGTGGRMGRREVEALPCGMKEDEIAGYTGQDRAQKWWGTERWCRKRRYKEGFK